MAERQESTEALRHALVQFLTEVIGAPDDEEIARNAAETGRRPALPTAWQPTAREPSTAA
ncbi:hypothetical protein ABT072_42540 [Streptomyces sp. NPDC002589]|uniref:hypothetical protein n=1 Tax=Streptomyces sp. NPDC002589 TaxID=3154420 RepID=UPI003319EB38